MKWFYVHLVICICKQNSIVHQGSQCQWNSLKREYGEEIGL